MGFASVAVDVGIVASEKSRISNTAELAALAGAWELSLNPGNAVGVADEYLAKNGLDPGRYFFARVLGYNKGEIKAKAGV
ncbi:MAG: pilus assembly protein TadG-related protein [Clostridia bacterium]|nr:pilus assembly protein TadG-related protein [Clostridia bacterium]